MNYKGGFWSPQEEEFQRNGSWFPVTPEKSILERSHPIPAERHVTQLGRANWQDLAETGISYIQEMQNPNCPVQMPNPVLQTGRNREYYNLDNSLPGRNQIINHIAGSYNQALRYDIQGLNSTNSTPLELLQTNNPAKVATANRDLNVSINMAANRPLLPKLHSQADTNRRDSHTSKLLLNNHSCHPGSDPSHTSSNRHLIPNKHSLIDSNHRDYNSLDFLLSNENHSSFLDLLNSSDNLSETSHYGFPMPCQPTYDLNSTPLTDVDAALSISNSIQLTPITTNWGTNMGNKLSAASSLIISESPIQEKNKPENSTTPIGDEIQQYCDGLLQNIVDSSSAVISTPNRGKEVEQKDSIRGKDQGFDLNKTPDQKAPKRQKHRPKVITEGKPKRIPKTATPKKAESNENLPKKRKYVRKNVLKPVATPQDDLNMDTTNPCGTTTRSCRRTLNFDLENSRSESQGIIVGQQEMQHGSKMTLSITSDTKVTKMCSLENIKYRPNSSFLISQQDARTVENQQTKARGDLTQLLNQKLTDTSAVERQTAAAPLATIEDLPTENSPDNERNLGEGNADLWQERSRNGSIQMHQHIHAEGNGSHNSLQLVKRILSNSNEGRGSKREHSHTIEDRHVTAINPIGSSLLCQEIFEVDRSHTNVFSETPKKRRTDNGPCTNIYGRPSCQTIDDDRSEMFRLQGKSDVNPNGLRSQLNKEILNSYFKKNTDAEKQSIGGGKYTDDQYASSCDINLLNQKNSQELSSHTERNRKTNGFINAPSFVSLSANDISQCAPAKAPASRRQVLQSSKANLSENNKTTSPTLTKSVPSGIHNVLPVTDVLNRNQQPMKETRGAALKIYPTPVDEITCQLEGLNLSGRNISSVQEQNALVPYKGNGSIVPYGGFEFIKKRKPRPKVDLDPETDRIWKLLMGKEGSEGLEGNDKEKEKWWEEERKIFRGRADSFIARMHLVQGDRRFSQWKGSVVDSVVGVFLTQNVSDHLSSSAFMSLAARFPLMSTNDDNVGTNILVEEPEVCIINPDDTVMPLGRLLSQETFTQGLVTLHDTTENWRENGTSGTSTSPVQQHGQSTEELISSEDSFNSSIIQGTGGIKSCSECTSEAEGPTTGCKSNKAYALPSNLLQVQKVTMFRDFYNSVNGGLLFDDRNKDGHMQYISHAKQNTRTDSRDSTSCCSTITYPIPLDTSQMQAPAVASSDYQLNDVDPGAQKLMSFETLGEESMSSWLQTSSALYKATDRNFRSLGIRGVGGSESTGKQNKILGSQELQMMNPYGPLSKHLIHPENISQSRLIPSNTPPSSNLQNDGKKILQLGDTSFPEPVSTSPRLDKRQNDAMRNSQMQDFPCFPKYTETNIDIEERTSAVNKQTHLDNILAEQKSTEQVYTSSQTYNEKNVKVSKANKMKAESEKKNVVDWDNLRKQVQKNGTIERRSKDTMDSLDYETLRHANVGEIANAIKERGMNNMLAERIKDFLNRLVRDHGSIDLEWLRDVPPDKSKDYLLSIRGLGLKSVECVRLLTLHHLAFPVDTNVGRIAVRLGWVPLQPLPESLQLHLLELYPVLESIQKYLWPRLCKFDQRTLYELHYQMITFGKVFCTKNKPNCNACPMRAECRHFASAFASARLALPGPEEKSIVSSTVPIASCRNPAVDLNHVLLPPPQNNLLTEANSGIGKCEPIIEEPATPEQECIHESDIEDIEDSFGEDPDEIPTIKLNMGEFQMNLQSYMQENMELQEGDMSKALVSLSQEAASIPTPKLKNVSRLRTEHQVYELPDSHPLLEKMDRREPDDPSPYLLAIWTPGETANSVEPSERSCGAQDSSNLCNEKTCFSCNSIREANSQVVRGTLLIPCRTATRGSFPLNGTYFQVNEVFADHDSSQSPIDVPRAWIWNLPRRTVYFGTSVSTIFKGLTTQGIQHCFWRGFVCVRGFDQKTRAPRPLTTRFHFPASKIAKRRNEN